MDGQRFDELARLAGAGVSRRRVIKGLVAGLAGIAVGVQARGAAFAGICQGSPNSAGPCPNGVGDCCNGYLCEGGVCVGDFGAPCVADEFCSSSFTCTYEDGTACAGDGDCQCRFPVLACLEEGDQCLVGGAFAAQGLTRCCAGLDCNTESGKCEAVSTCGVAGDSCTVDLDCCLPNFVCNTGTGFCEAVTAPTCSTEGDDCETDGDCCDGICCGGSCHDIECCIEDDDPNERCGDGETCFEGVCDSDDTGGETPDPEPELPTTLPDTGAGSDADEMNGLVGFGVAAGAAAFVAGSHLKRKAATTGE